MTTPSPSNTIHRVVALGIGLKQANSLEAVKENLSELESLIYAAGGEVVASLTQMLQQFQPPTLIGAGKIEEIRQLSEKTEADLLVVDHHLTGIQTRNLEKALKIRVVDRSQLILDIFAQRAQTYEGQLQVELAQMLDQLPRMVGAWLSSLSRQGGGIGTRGPGETALEVDRRRIRERIKVIEKKLEDVKKHRALQRSQRKRSQVPSFSLIGYTNSGKSSLLNTLCRAEEVLAQDQLFATLDPTTRKIYIKSLGTVVATDTVGFINKLPTQLITAFRATLEETAASDLLLHVIDISHKSYKTQIETVAHMIKECGWEDKPQIYVLNKSDKISIAEHRNVTLSPHVFISALTGEGVERLKKKIKEEFLKLGFAENTSHSKN